MSSNFSGMKIARLLRNLRGFPPKASLSAAHLRGRNPARLALARSGVPAAARSASGPYHAEPAIAQSRNV